MFLCDTFPLPDCKVFTLEEFSSQYVNEVAHVRDYTTLGECFIWCFNIQGCYTFAYDGLLTICRLYIQCGTNCETLNTILSYKKVYVHHCHNGKYIQPIISV